MDQHALAGLENDYQILTELHRDAGGATYLARHRELNRDVTITVVKPTDTYAADVERLEGLKHANVIPVIDGRALPDGSFAVIRARVRGTTLEQLLSAVGALPQSRIDAALTDISSALTWAKNNRIANRRVSADSLMFQQGSGRALLSFEPSPEPADDQRTLRDLGAAMHGGTPPTPASAHEPSVVVVKRRGMSFGARVFTAFVVVAAVVLGFVLFTRYRASQQPPRTATISIDSSTVGGEAALHTVQPDTAVYPTPHIVEPPPAPPPPVTTQPAPPLTMPERMPRMPEPSPRPPIDTSVRLPVDTSVRPPAPSSGDVCDSVEPGDQRNCLAGLIAKADRDMNVVYQKLIAALRRQANVSDADPDPASVEDLRSAQRRWMEDRDASCRGTGTGLLYARERATCFADRASSRATELQQQLDAIP